MADAAAGDPLPPPGIALPRLGDDNEEGVLVVGRGRRSSRVALPVPPLVRPAPAPPVLPPPAPAADDVEHDAEEQVVVVAAGVFVALQPYDPLGVLPDVEGQPLREELSVHGYHRIHVKCPLHRDNSGSHFGCCTSRVVNCKHTSHFGKLELIVF